MATLSKGALFDPTLVSELFSKVQGKSSLAALSGASPIPFNGMKEFTFALDNEVDIVAESGAKSHGGASLSPVTIIPVKFEYGARVSDEFMYAAEEDRIAILQAFADGFAKKLAAGFDKAAMHGINPRTGSASTVVGANHIDGKGTVVSYDTGLSADENIEKIINTVEAAGGTVSGIAISPAMRQDLAALKNSANERLYPELAWGGQPNTLNGLAASINPTVANDKAIVGDFANAFKWGYAKEIPLEVIEYGDPDNSGSDLKGHNQVYLRCECYIGWGVLDPNAFAVLQ